MTNIINKQVEERINIVNKLAGSDHTEIILRNNLYSRYGNLAQALYTDPMKRGLIKGNADTFIAICDRTVSKWAYSYHFNSEEFNKALLKYPELKGLFSSWQEFNKSLSNIEEWTGKPIKEISFKELVMGLYSFNSERIIPFFDDMETLDEDELEIEETSYFNEEEPEEDEIHEDVELTIENGSAPSQPTIDINRQIAEVEADLDSGELDSESEQSIRLLINDLKQHKAELTSTDENMVESDKFKCRKKEELNNLKDYNANFMFTKKELNALEKAFKEVGFHIKSDEDSELTNFVAVKRSDFSATFIFSTLGMLESKRSKFIEVFKAYTGYSTFGEIDSAPYGRQDWWAIECITNNRKFTVAEWPGTELAQYNELGNLRKIWLGTSLREKHLTMDWLDAQNSFNLIGGKSRSGKTCLSHSMLIQGICGGILPTFLDWKPEGSDLYRELGFYTVQRDARAWLPQGMEQGLHLMNIMEALAWIKAMSLAWSNRELGGKRDFDKNKLATPEDPNLLFVFDEIAAFIGTIGSIRIAKKSEKDLTPQEKATKAVTDYANNIFKGLNTCLAACATYGIKFMGITQDIMMSDSVWADKAWGGDEGKNFRKKMLNTFWGRGSVRGLDCPITEQKERSYVNMGQGRFGFEQNGQSKTFRALRIDNTVSERFPGIDAKAVLTNCLNTKGISIPSNRYSYFEMLLNSVKNSPDFMSVINSINEGFNGTKTDNSLSDKYSTSVYANYYNSDIRNESKKPVEINSSIANNTLNKQGANGIQMDFGDESKELEKQDVHYRSPIIVEKQHDSVSSMQGKDGRTSIFSQTENNNYSVLNNENSIDCRNTSAGSLSWIEKFMLDTPLGAEKYIKKVWKAILDNILSKGYKRANISRLSIYGGHMYVNGKIVNLNGVIGGFECIRLRDMVSFKTLFKTFFMIRELRIDEDILRVAVMELGDNAIQLLFELGQKLEVIFLQSEKGEVVRIDRKAVKKNSANKLVEKSKSFNNIDLHCFNISKKSWKQRLAGDNIWGMRLAKQSLGNAGRMFMAKNKPSVGKAAIYAGVGILVGSIGGIAYGIMKLAGKLGSLTGLFKK